LRDYETIVNLIAKTATAEGLRVTCRLNRRKYPTGRKIQPGQQSYAVLRYSAMQHIPIDEYVIDVLLPDLSGHDHAPTAFLVYIILWTALYRAEQRRVALSLRNLSEGAGLSKSAVQSAVRLLKRRGLIKVFKASPTAVPEYELVRHWVRRRAR